MTNFFGRVAFRSLSLGMVPGHGREDLGVGADCFASKTISQRTIKHHMLANIGKPTFGSVSLSFPIRSTMGVDVLGNCDHTKRSRGPCVGPGAHHCLWLHAMSSRLETRHLKTRLSMIGH